MRFQFVEMNGIQFGMRKIISNVTILFSDPSLKESTIVVEHQFTVIFD